MSNLKYFALVIATALFVFGAQSAFSQTAPVRGVVKVHKQDGTEVPVADATVDAYRTDIGKGSMPAAKTNKRGEFSFVGFQLGQTYAIAVSGPGISPKVQPNVKAGQEDIVIVTTEGDGRKVTEDEVRSFVTSGAAKTGPTDPKTASKEEQEYQKKVAAYNAEKKKAEDTSKIVNAAFQEGDKLYKAKDYDGAIAKFDEGINADPEFEGSAPILLNYKAAALKDRAVATFNGSMNGDANAKAAALEKTKADLSTAQASVDKGLSILKNAPAATDPNAQKSREGITHNLLSSYVDVLRLFVKTHADSTKAKEAGPIFEQYLAIETDPAKKLSAQLTLGEMMQDAGDSQGAIDAYMAALTTSPENVDALAGAGFSLINLGYINNDKSKFQEGVNYLQKYVSVAPEGHKYKADAVSLIESLKKEQNVTPQKVAPPKKKP